MIMIQKSTGLELHQNGFLQKKGVRFLFPALASCFIIRNISCKKS